MLLRTAAATIAVYSSSLAILLRLGWAQDQATTGTWLSRTALYAIAAMAAMLLSTSGRGAERTGPAGPGPVLLAAGLVWSQAGVLDMHVFDLFALAHGAPAWDLVFHGSGFLAMCIGFALAVRTPIPRLTVTVELETAR